MVQQLFPYHVGKLTAKSFLSTYWNMIPKYRKYEAQQLTNADVQIERDKRLDLLQMRS